MEKKWKSVAALAVAGVFVVATAWAQATSPGDKSMPGKSDMKSDMGKMDKKSARGGKSSEQVKAIQQALKDKGHDPGDVDGMMGPKTRTALKDFQKAQGMQPTGRPDGKTMTALGVEAKTSGTESSSPSASPTTGSGTSTGPESKSGTKK